MRVIFFSLCLVLFFSCLESKGSKALLFSYIDKDGSIVLDESDLECARVSDTSMRIKLKEKSADKFKAYTQNHLEEKLMISFCGVSRGPGTVIKEAIGSRYQSLGLAGKEEVACANELEDLLGVCL